MKYALMCVFVLLCHGSAEAQRREDPKITELKETVREQRDQIRKLERQIQWFRRQLAGIVPDDPVVEDEYEVQRIDPVRPGVIDVEVGENWYQYGEERTVSNGSPIAEAYAAVDQDKKPFEPVVIGVRGIGGRIGVGSAQSKFSPSRLKDKDGSIDVIFVGLDAAAEVGPIHLGEQYDPVGRAEFYDIGLRGSKDSFVIRQYGYVREMVFDNFWVVSDMEGMYASVFHLHQDWESLTIKGYQWRGLPLREHVAYLKPGGRVQLLDNELMGGRRTGFQIRPHGEGSSPASPKPHGDIVIDGNTAEGFGWNHQDADGGQWMTVWCSLDNKVRITNNTCIDARYGCLGIAQGVESSNPYLTESGYSHTDVFIANNVFENKRGNRHCVAVVAAEKVRFHNNRFVSHQMPLSMGSEWSSRYTQAKPVKDWSFTGRVPDWDVWVYEGAYRRLTREEVIARSN